MRFSPQPSPNMEDDDDLEHDFIFYSLLYTSITVLFAMAVLSKFLTNEFRFGFRSILSLGILFIGEPLCHLMVKGPSGVVIFGLGCLLVYSILPASHFAGKNKTVFITGCDSGFGHDLAKKLDSSGMQVFAGCLFKDGPGAIDLQNSCSDRLHVLEVDVTKEKQIDQAYDHICSLVGETGLWSLVNNAGISYIAELEMTPDKILRNLMEVNLFGMIKVTQTFLPLVRKSKGRIVNMSSLAGRVGFEGVGPYCISKSGIEAFSDVLRLEMKKWGVQVCTIEPSGYKTGNTRTQLTNSQRDETWKHMSDDIKSLYGKEYFDKMYSNYDAAAQKFPDDLTPVVRAMKSAVLSKRPLQRYVVGKGAWTFLTVFPLLPVWLGDWIVHALGTAVVEFPPAQIKDSET